MKEFALDFELWLPRPRNEIFPFFAEARNLETITPPWVHFRILTTGPVRMEVGAKIDYRIKIHGWPVRWRTEITAWNPPERFTDEQRSGPYRLWRHTHIFTEENGGTRCEDHVRYHPIGGAVMNWLFVRRDVERIFEYRRKRLIELFGAAPGNSPKQV